MDEIAAEAGITKPILYSHFGDKAGLVQALAERVARRLNRTVTEALTRSGEPRDVVASTIEAFCTFIEDETELYRFLVQSARHDVDASGPRLLTDIGSQISVSLGSALRRAGADSGAAEPWAFAIVGMTFGGRGLVAAASHDVEGRPGRLPHAAAVVGPGGRRARPDRRRRRRPAGTAPSASRPCHRSSDRSG